MTTGRINQVAIVQEATFPLRPKAETVGQPPNTTASGWFSITAVAELFPYGARPPAHTHTQARTRACAQPATHTFMDTGLFRVSSGRQDNKNTPPSFDSFVNLLPRQHPSNKDCQTLPVRTQTKLSAFRHERRWCEASTTHSQACEQASRARLRHHFSNLMRYSSYAQRTSTTLPSCGKLQFLKTQSRQRALFTRAPPPPRRQDVSPRHA